MKPKLYYGTDVQQFAPCEAVRTMREESIKTHPFLLAIRDKRKRKRHVRIYLKNSIKHFLRPVWEIHPTNAVK
ncbi:hypothetical protein UFOVP736_38 [uncultured Caudovirales phage]|uniref:Uncharacterized protein n=1 Tax=uncultured Caudovirales phage TaxID=2100421 RepID=A0A6J7X235_9CAUD|nr:hypothetical protein UFOVP705_43 [uncultured Caudovirales phage]CAB5224184.1 hypothetical protein UFOVP736_38 [uncultured Caudovirales phage]